MTIAAIDRGRSHRELAIVSTVSLALIFAQSVVFASFGIVLFSLSRDLGWSASGTGFAYTIVIAGACVAAPMPMFLIRWIGGSWTIAAGQAVLCGAFVILAAAVGSGQVYLAALLVGIGFSLTANTPGVYLLSGWFGSRASRLIGIYLMIGMLGNAAGPPTVQAIITALGWRGYCVTASIVAAVITGLCWRFLREPPLLEPVGGQEAPMRRLGHVLRSPLFLTLAAAVVASQTCIVTIASIAPAHLANQGMTTAYTGRLLGMEGLVSALATGLIGYGVRFVHARRILPVVLLAGAAAMAILALNRDSVILMTYALLMGVSAGGTTLAVTLLLVRYFGSVQGASALSAVWTLAGLSAIGPWISGLVADSTGGYAPALLGIGLVLVPIAVFGLLLLPRERSHQSEEKLA